jgi:hypothetical protein
MARLPGYEAADLFRKRCLMMGSSLLSPTVHCWTPDNLMSLWDAFMGHPDEGDRSFLEKLHDQLNQAPTELHRVAADLLAFYHLFPLGTSRERKLKDVREVISWKLESEPAEMSLLDAAFAKSIGRAGMPYMRRRPEQVSYFLQFARQLYLEKVDPSNVEECRSLADRVQSQIKYSTPSRHILLHLLFPDEFERIASGNHKTDIVTAFREYAEGESDVDLALKKIRAALSAKYGRGNLDFYDEDIKAQWYTPAEDDGPVPQAQKVKRWIEKTIVRGRPDRESGEFAIGKALWSPHRGKGGADIYRFMREVAAGDVVLHLTDNEGFSGISRAASGVTDFNGVSGTEWGEGPSYLIPLKNFQRLEPPLSRDLFFASPFKERLTALIDAGQKNLFYSHEPTLNRSPWDARAQYRA